MSQLQGHTGPGPAAGSGPASAVVEEVEVRGHIVDSLLLPKILDRILLMGGTFEIRECRIGVRRSDPSYARIAIGADGHEALEAILGDLVEHGASPVHPEDAQVVAGRHRRRVPRGLLQHDQPADAGPPGRAVGRPWTTRRWIAGSWSTATAAGRGASR